VRPARPTAAPRVRGCWLVPQTRQWRQSWIRVEPPPSPPSPPWAGPAGGSVGEAAVHSCLVGAKISKLARVVRASCARRHCNGDDVAGRGGGVCGRAQGPCGTCGGHPALGGRRGTCAGLGAVCGADAERRGGGRQTRKSLASDVTHVVRVARHSAAAVPASGNLHRHWMNVGCAHGLVAVGSGRAGGGTRGQRAGGVVVLGATVRACEPVHPPQLR
jgi:hypothetical protein